MVDLKTFIADQFITEAKMTSADWLNTSHTYPQDVISRLMSKQPIPLGKNGKEGEYLATPEEIKRLAEFTPEYTKDSMNEFNNIFNGNLKWSQIFKGEFSGYKSQEEGQVVESLVCHIFNEGIDNADIAGWWLDMCKKEEDTSWNNSCIETVKFINSQDYGGTQWTNKDYVACHVDGHDYHFPTQYEFARQITSFFRDKKEATSILSQGGNKVNCNNLYTGQKDTWNKADIVLVNKKGENIISDMQKVVSDGNSLNVELLKYLNEGMIIPISLKKITSADKAKIEGYNINEAEEANKHNIQAVLNIRVQDKFPENKYQGTLSLVCQSLEGEPKIDFSKSTSSGNNLNVEASNGKLARAGKALSNIKNSLGLGKKDDFFVVKDTNEEALKELEDYGFTLKIKGISNWKTAKPEIRERASVAGLLGLLKVYKEKKCHNVVDKDFALNFANFCWLCATKGTGAFFKVYE